jgi:hypothetical protein
MNNENKVIFSSINFTTEDDFLPTIQNLNDEQKKEIVKRILEYSYKQGIYSLTESEFISMLVRYL